MKHSKWLLGISLLVLIGAAAMPHTADAVNIWQGTSCAQGGGGPTQPCSLCDALVVIANVIQFLMYLTVTVSAGVIAWGGFKMMISGGNPKTFGEGKSMIFNALIGLAISLCAWLFIDTFLSFFTSGGLTFAWNQLKCY